MLLGIVFVLVPVIRRARAQRISSFQSTILDKKKKTTMIYTGVFIPLVIYFLRVEKGIEFKVNHTVYQSVEIGDTVLVSMFSDGSYRLDQ
jgi:uncharacterized membrane protein